MALKGVKVLEFVGLAPGPLCGKILADFGATITRIDKVAENQLDVFQQGKRTLVVDLKHPRGQEIVHQLALRHDVLIEPFRPGVMEKLNLGPQTLCQEQPKLIYARLTGFGQSGPLAERAGHDINYAAVSGVLSMLGRQQEKPIAPINLLADFAGGSLLCALGICLALLERHRSGQGQVIDASMVDGAAYVASWLFMSRKLPLWGEERGLNILDGGAYFYDTYKTKDGKYMSVGALEPQFFDAFKERLGLPELNQYTAEKSAKALVTAAFLQKTQAEWSSIFEDVDACVYPVVDWQNIMQHKHNAYRNSFQVFDGVIEPKPAPRLSRTPGNVEGFRNERNLAQEAIEILGEIDLNSNDVRQLMEQKVLLHDDTKAKL